MTNENTKTIARLEKAIKAIEILQADKNLTNVYLSGTALMEMELNLRGAKVLILNDAQHEKG